MNYISDSSNGRGKRGPKDPYSTETLARYEREEHILPSNGSRKIDDVEVKDSNKIAKKVSEESMDFVTRSETSSIY